jgi:ketosteroid isomerase-like protein
MNPSTPPLKVETDALLAAYAALNRGDIDGFCAIFDPDIERVEPAGFPMAGTYRGIEAVKEHVRHGRGTWAEGTCEPTKAIAAGDKVVLLCHVHVRVKGQEDWIDGDLADVWTFKDGKAVGYRSFGDPREGLAFAGVRDPHDGAR